MKYPGIRRYISHLAASPFAKAQLTPANRRKKPDVANDHRHKLNVIVPLCFFVKDFPSVSTSGAFTQLRMCDSSAER